MCRKHHIVHWHVLFVYFESVNVLWFLLRNFIAYAINCHQNIKCLHVVIIYFVMTYIWRSDLAYLQDNYLKIAWLVKLLTPRKIHILRWAISKYCVKFHRPHFKCDLHYLWTGTSYAPVKRSAGRHWRNGYASHSYEEVYLKRLWVQRRISNMLSTCPTVANSCANQCGWHRLRMEAIFSLKIWGSYRVYPYAEPERFDTMIICESMRIDTN